MTKKTSRRELTEWLIIVVVGLTLYFTGLHTEVIGLLQRGLLATGLMQPTTVDTHEKATFDFVLTDLDGQEVLFSDFEGETIFLNFWATWCPPCIAEMPDIEALYQLKASSVHFVMISLDENRIKAREFVEKKGFQMPIYFLKSSLPRTYETTSIPTTYVISPAGTIVVENHGMAQYNTTDFRKLLDELNQSAVSNFPS